MNYKLPQLPYSPDELSPIISKETVGYHYGKHEQTYIDNLNKLIKGTKFEDMPLEEIIKTSTGALFNNASQAWNHIFYFFGLSPQGGGEPTGVLRLAIEDAFDSVENFIQQMKEAGGKLFGSGWVWLVKDTNDKLSIVSTSNADNPMREGYMPIMCIDVWEHAYYLDYQNKRAEYLDKIWDIVNWDIVCRRFLQKFSHTK
ncbi:MAG: superoxide dismutase [Muribaculaceae bacterium]|nr:superoxide dismutase [Muribaculaceae bacterium]